MSIGVFAIVLWLVLGLDEGVSGLLRVGQGGVAPSLVLPLIVFIGLYAPQRAATGAALVAGMLIDLLTFRVLAGGGAAVVPGPNALGMALAVQVVLAARGLVFLNSPVTLVVLTPAAGIVWQVTTVCVLALRGVYDDTGSSAGSMLVPGLLGALYSAGPALVLWFPLRWAMPLMRFDSPHVARIGSRR
ncbi:MAG: hypothetical protein AAFR96_04465 [Planctomycetota bacterium]